MYPAGARRLLVWNRAQAQDTWYPRSKRQFYRLSSRKEKQFSQVIKNRLQFSCYLILSRSVNAQSIVGQSRIKFIHLEQVDHKLSDLLRKRGLDFNVIKLQNKRHIQPVLSSHDNQSYMHFAVLNQTTNTLSKMVRKNWTWFLRPQITK